MIPWGTPIDQSVVSSYIVSARWMGPTLTSSKPLKHTQGVRRSAHWSVFVAFLLKLLHTKRNIHSDRTLCSVSKENQPMRLKIVKQAYLEFILVALEPHCCSLYHVSTLYFDDGSCFVLFTLLGLLFHWM